jgi:cell division topological specificity factor
MNIISFFKRPVITAPVAKDRLKLLLAHERAVIGNANVVALLREEIVAVIAKHFPVEPSSIKVRMETGDTISTLEVEAEIPTPLCANPKRTAEIAVEAAAVQKKKTADAAAGG